MMMPNPLAIMGVHTATLNRRIITADGPMDGEPVIVTGCYVEERIHVVLDPSGRETVASAVIATQPGAVDVDPADDWTATLPSGHVGRVLAVEQVADPSGKISAMMPLIDYLHVE